MKYSEPDDNIPSGPLPMKGKRPTLTACPAAFAFASVVEMRSSITRERASDFISA